MTTQLQSPSPITKCLPPEGIHAVILHKPPGCISTRSRPELPKRATAYDHLPLGWENQERRLGHCGRLDRDTTGLLLFTDDGLLNQAPSNPSFKHASEELPLSRSVEKTYHLRIAGMVSESTLQSLSEPIIIGENRKRGSQLTRAARIREMSSQNGITWIECILSDGRNKQIRRLCKRSRITLTQLKRVRFGPLELGDLREGEARSLTQAEVNACYQAVLPNLQPPRIQPLS